MRGIFSFHSVTCNSGPAVIYVYRCIFVNHLGVTMALGLLLPFTRHSPGKLMWTCGAKGHIVKYCFHFLNYNFIPYALFLVLRFFPLYSVLILWMNYQSVNINSCSGLTSDTLGLDFLCLSWSLLFLLLHFMSKSENQGLWF